MSKAEAQERPSFLQGPVIQWAAADRDPGGVHRGGADLGQEGERPGLT